MIEGRNRRREGEIVEVQAEQTTELAIGPPLTVKTDVQQRGRIVRVGLVIVGIAGETYVPYVLKDGKPLPAPKITIMDESQNIVSSGKFEYG